mmetsp:Transcript_62693/g.111791  ORF Transcript_62693/g.111791 Transcript_62693/m.111791 type:complete len:103 (-) Transcript_62693:247-555(-)
MAPVLHIHHHSKAYPGGWVGVLLAWGAAVAGKQAVGNLSQEKRDLSINEQEVRHVRLALYQFVRPKIGTTWGPRLDHMLNKKQGPLIGSIGSMMEKRKQTVE